MESSHPEAGRLAEFAEGLLPPDEAEATSHHVLACPACRERLAGLHKARCATSPTAAGTAAHSEAEAGIDLSGDWSTVEPGQQTRALAGAAPPGEGAVPAELLKHPRYEILGPIGAGAMGVVYKARHRLMGRLVALKVVRGSLLDRPEMVARFEREIRAAAHLAHPNIVTAFDAEAAGPLHFLVMEFVRGKNLSKVLAEGGPLPVARACDYARQTALGLQHAFEQGMVHRDIKPANLVRTAGAGGEVVKVLDFGLARFVRETHPAEGLVGEGGSGGAPPDRTAAGRVLGTLDYIAPEQIHDARSADIRADLYSLGCTLYHMLTGRPPFPGLSPAAKIEAHLRAAPPPLRAQRKDVPRALARVVGRLLEKDPARRYQTPAEVAAALAPFTGGAARSRRRRFLLGAALVVLAAALFWAGRVALRPPAAALRERSAEPAAPPEVAPASAIRRLTGHTAPVFAVAWFPDGRRLISAGKDKTLRLWDAESGLPAGRWDGSTGGVMCVAVAPDGKHVLSGGEDRVLRLWDVDEGREVGQLAGHGGTVRSVAWSPDGLRAVSGGEDGTVRVWDVVRRQEVRRWVAHGTHWVQGVAYSHDGTRLLSAGEDHLVRLWDAAGGAELRTFAGHRQQAMCVAFSPDDRRAASGGEDWTAFVWDLDGGAPPRHLQGHKNFIWSVGFSPDGRRVLTTSWDRTARLWDAETGRLVQRMDADTEELLCGAVSPDGRSAACAGSEAVLFLWQLPP